MNTTVHDQIYVAPAHTAGRTVEATGSVRRLTTLWWLLRLTFGLVPIVAGLDKFTNLLVNWENYLNPAILQMLPIGGRVLMGIVGVVEIVAGVIVLARPRLGGSIVMVWCFVLH